jgi:hypothetical protein
MLPCINECPDGNLEEMRQDRPARDANEHPRRRPEAPFNPAASLNPSPVATPRR